MTRAATLALGGATALAAGTLVIGGAALAVGAPGDLVPAPETGHPGRLVLWHDPDVDLTALAPGRPLHWRVATTVEGADSVTLDAELRAGGELVAVHDALLVGLEACDRPWTGLDADPTCPAGRRVVAEPTRASGTALHERRVVPTAGGSGESYLLVTVALDGVQPGDSSLHGLTGELALGVHAEAVAAPVEPPPTLPADPGPELPDPEPEPTPDPTLAPVPVPEPEPEPGTDPGTASDLASPGGDASLGGDPGDLDDLGGPADLDGPGGTAGGATDTLSASADGARGALAWTGSSALGALAVGLGAVLAGTAARLLRSRTDTLGSRVAAPRRAAAAPHRAAVVPRRAATTPSRTADTAPGPTVDTAPGRTTTARPAAPTAPTAPTRDRP